MKRSSLRSWRLPAVAVAAAAIVSACGDAITVPGTPVGVTTANVAPAKDADPGHDGDSPDNLSLSLPAPDIYNGSATLSGNLGRYPHPTVVQATISGGIETYTPNFQGIGPSQGPFGPEGRTVLFFWDGNFTHRFDFFTRSLYFTFVGSGELFNISRSPLGTLELSGFRPIGTNIFIFCGPTWGTPCFSYGGDAGTMNLRRLQSVLQANPEKENAELNETPFFDYRANPMVVEGQNIPFVVDSTHWIPDPPDQGGSAEEVPVHAAGEGACQRIGDGGCRHRMKGSGTFRVDAWVNGKWFTKSMHVTVGTEKVTITPIPPREPTITIPEGSLCTQAMTSINQRNIRVHVTRSDGSPVAGRQVRLTLKAKDDGGGHLASGHAPDRPWGSIPQDVLTTDAAGNGVVLWTIPEFSGDVSIKAELVGVSGKPDSTTVEVEIPGLVELPDNPTKYQRVGIIPELHPQSHFGLSGLISELTKLADSTTASTKAGPGFIVGINDMSLPLGGRFDVTAKGTAGGQWNASPNHCSHRNGNAADFETNTLSGPQRKRVLLQWIGVLKHSKLDEGDHYHLKLPAETN